MSDAKKTCMISADGCVGLGVLGAAIAGFATGIAFIPTDPDASHPWTVIIVFISLAGVSALVALAGAVKLACVAITKRANEYRWLREDVAVLKKGVGQTGAGWDKYDKGPFTGVSGTVVARLEKLESADKKPKKKGKK